ncbi:MAG: hypothetical protein K2M31_03525 [Muribaculaceae bacterium]|nr:hypothetical protein [Muribaculaceae bacterium]
MASSQTKVLLKVGGNSMTATLTDNEATRELTKLLEHGDLTIRMSDYGGFEKVGALPQSFPTSNTQITTVPGDIMFYQGNQMVIFYGSNSWSYTRLGKIDGATADSLRQFLGNGDVTLTLSLESSGIENVTADANKEEIIYDLNGRRITKKPLAPGIYIINGKKTIIRQ